ncbi:MAG: Gfo/Idh/MocA family protein [Marinibacterium sp.]
MTWRVAILGAGIGAEHLTGYLVLPDRFEVAAICDIDRSRAQALADRAGAAVLSDMEAVLTDPAIDIVDICLPPSLHAPVAERALRAGKHVICEKPVAGSPAEAHRLAGIARAAGRRAFPVFQYRFGRAFYALQALRGAALSGAPRAGSLETHWNRGAEYYANPWRGTWAHEMGGAVLSHAIHAHDLIRFAFGPVSGLSAMLGTLVNPIETEDCAAIAMRTQTGALVTSSITLGAADDTSRLRLVFEHLTAESGAVPYAPGQADWTFRARDPARQAEIDAVLRGLDPDQRQGFAGLFAAIADDLSNGGTAAPSWEDAAASVEFAAAVYRAHRTGRAVILPLDPEAAEYQRLAPDG